MEKYRFLKGIVSLQQRGEPSGIYSICSYNYYVLRAAFIQAKENETPVLIEATCNQVNQYGGYTGMNPEKFREYVFSIADSIDFPQGRIILGGDHLGPFPFKEEEAETGMKKAHEMVKSYVLSGYTKIHLDTSIILRGDPVDEKGALKKEISASRCAALCLTAEETFKSIKSKNLPFSPPVYVIGTEVPSPGGSNEVEGGIHVTEVSDFEETVSITREYFYKKNLEKAWERVIAVVVQPGVEYGDHTVINYDREKAKELSSALKRYPHIVFEGHSTDYQTKKALKELVEDGVAILKVGPALTFAVREGIFLLNYIEEEIFKNKKDIKLSKFISTLDSVMVNNPKHWKKYYKGDEDSRTFARKYSFFDRCRYYWMESKVIESLETLIKNLKSTDIPLSLISQFFPLQYIKIREGILKKDPEMLIIDRIMEVLKDYAYATGNIKSIV